MDLLHLCVTPTYCQYNGKHCKQLHGRAMGSPISIAVAEILMQNIEATYSETLPLCGYVVVQFLLWNNLLGQNSLNWYKIV